MRNRWLFVIVAAYIVCRIYIATLSSYGFYHGWNEGYYSLFAKNYFTGSLWEQIAYPGGSPFSAVPPFFSYTLFSSFKVFGISDISARLVSILSEIIAISGVYILAKETYNEKVAQIAALLFLFIPWNVLWFGRVQTDPLMTALMTLAIALYVRAYKNNKSMLPFGITLGLAIFTKQPALATLPIVFIWSYFKGFKKKEVINAIFWFSTGMLPLITWLSYYVISGNYDVASHTIFGELVHRMEPFSNITKVVIFTAAGISPLVIMACFYQIFREKNIKNILTIWLLIYGVFVIVRTPPSHEYYSLPLMAPFAIFASAGIVDLSKSVSRKSAMLVLTVVVILSTIPITYVLMNYNGDAGYTATRDVGVYLKNYMDENPENEYLVLVQMKYSPQLAWYAGLGVDGDRVIYSTIDELSVTYINEIVKDSDNKVIFLVVDEDAEKGVLDEYENVKTSGYDGNILDLAQSFANGKGLILYKLQST